MVEGPGHIPMDQIEMNIEKQTRVCHEAPFYVLGPLVTDIAPGYDHITCGHRRGAGRLRPGRRCSATSRRRSTSACPNKDDVRQGVIAYKIAAHAADIARGRKNARDRDDALSARPASSSTGTSSSTCRSTPKPPGGCTTRRCRRTCSSRPKFCSMCGPKFCSMRITEDIRKMAEKQSQAIPVVTG